MPAQVHGGLGIPDMPVDAIFLSASPPGLGHSFHPSALTYLQTQNRFNMGIGLKGDVRAQMQHSPRKLPLRSCIKHQTPSANGTSSCGPLADFPCNNGVDHALNKSISEIKRNVKPPNSPGLARRNGSYIENDVSRVENGKKRVTFADTKGYSLHTVKYMDGPSSEPPTLRIHLLQDVIQNEEAKPTHPYTYVPEFEQPASNYLAFRGRLEKENVCLENVLVRDNITVVGTIKVKNISFEKSVFVRATFDEWKTHKDVPASYAFPSQASSLRDKFDTFSFTFDLPPNLSGRNFEFCICYDVNHQSFWDNNQGNNYKFVTEKARGTAQREELTSFQNLNGDYSWGEFSYWQATQDNERPYW